MSGQYVYGGTLDDFGEGDALGAGVTRPAAQEPAPGTKVCPRCGARLFADMDVCYGCLYDFSHPAEGFVSLPDPDAHDDWGPGPGSTASVGVRPTGPRLSGPAAMGSAPVSQSASGCPDRTPGAGEASSTATWDTAPDGGTREARGVSGEGWPGAFDREPGAIDPDSATLDHMQGAFDPEATLVSAEAEVKAPMRVRVSSPGMVVTLPIGERGISLGRSPGNDVVLPVRTVSREHLRLVVRSGEVIAFDQGATNPATLNGEPLGGGVVLQPGDLVEIGQTHVRLLGT